MLGTKFGANLKAFTSMALAPGKPLKCFNILKSVETAKNGLKHVKTNQGS